MRRREYLSSVGAGVMVPTLGVRRAETPVFEVEDVTVTGVKQEYHSKLERVRRSISYSVAVRVNERVEHYCLPSVTPIDGRSDLLVDSSVVREALPELQVAEPGDVLRAEATFAGHPELREVSLSEWEEVKVNLDQEGEFVTRDYELGEGLGRF